MRYRNLVLALFFLLPAFNAVNMRQVDAAFDFQAPAGSNDGVCLPGADCRDNAVPNSGAIGCTIIELYPGYPGYRGAVAGLIGRSDTACFESLQSQYPSFDRESEDAANLEIAQQLGVTGSFSEWPWETWAVIGVIRGRGADPNLLNICYFCLMLDPNAAPAGPNPPVTSDPRLQNQLHSVLQRYFQLTGSVYPIPSAIAEIFSWDDWGRVRGYLFSELSQPTAIALNDSVESSQGDRFGLDQHAASCIVNTRGGYTYVAPGSHLIDQFWSATLGMLLAPLTNGQLASNIAIATLSNLIDNYRRSYDEGSISFSDYVGQQFC